MGGRNTEPIYAHCAHCDFPIVVPAGERWSKRRCRQCGRSFVPGENPRPFADEKPGSGAVSILRRLIRRKVYLRPGESWTSKQPTLDPNDRPNKT